MDKPEMIPDAPTPNVRKMPEREDRLYWLIIQAWRLGHITNDVHNELLELLFSGRAAEAEAKFREIIDGLGKP